MVNHNYWERLHPLANADHLGYIANFLDNDDLDDARTQLDKNYKHGGGFFPSGEGVWRYDTKTQTLHYPDDPPYHALWRFLLRDEEIIVFDHALVMVRDPKTKQYVVARMD